MDFVKDSESCTNCGHDHLPGSMHRGNVNERVDVCGEPGCDCDNYLEPEGFLRVYKCSSCTMMTTRVHSSSYGGQYCDDCYHDF